MGELLHQWHSDLGLDKCRQEFMAKELERWRNYVDQMNKYNNDVVMNRMTFDDKRVKDCADLKILCYGYYREYAAFSVTDYEKLIQSVLVSQQPLVD
jgi:hypothetical protein